MVCAGGEQEKKTFHKKDKTVIEEFKVEEYKEYDTWGGQDDGEYSYSGPESEPQPDAEQSSMGSSSLGEDDEYDAWGRIQRETLPDMDLYSHVEKQLGAHETGGKASRLGRKLLL